MLNVLLIDDEASARADLREKLRAHPDVIVVGEAATLGAARALLASTDYQLVLLDVQLIGGMSFDLVPFVRPGASIVFATAHERYAARAFESRAVDYLLKPIVPARLADALLRVAGARVFPVSAVSAVQFAPTQASFGPAIEALPTGSAEVALARDERVFLRQMLEAWEDSLLPTHRLRLQPAGKRIVHYERNAPQPRLFLARESASAARRCWRALCNRLAS